MTKIIIKPILLSLTNKRKITVHKNNYYSKKLTILQLLIHISLPKLRIFSWVSSCALHGHCAGKRAKKKKKEKKYLAANAQASTSISHLERRSQIS